jgi:hypothetical protein
MAISKGQLIADPAIVLDGDSVVSFMRDGVGNAITSTSGKLDVQIGNTSIAVTATNLDIRDLVFATDKVDVSGSAVSITGTVAVTQSTIPWVVSATDLDIRNLAFATDTVDVSGSAVTVSATNLDIRDLTHVSDSIKIGDGTDFLAVNADGSINVTGSFSINGQYAEDSAHVSGDIGLYNLAVRADAPAVASSASGDYASQTVDAYNRSWINPGSNISIANGSASVTTSTGLLVAAAAGRRKILVQNLGGKKVYLGASGVSTANGIQLPSGADLELEIGPALALHAVAESGTMDVRYLQLA